MSRDAIARERIKALQQTVRDGLETQDRATGKALDAAEKAVLKAEVAMEKRFEGVNEFRQTLSDQAATFIRRTEVEAEMKTVKATLTRLEGVAATNAGKGQGADYLWKAILAVGAVILAAAALLLR